MMTPAMMNASIELWLIRHGETTSSVRHRIAGWVNALLTEVGEEEARALKPFLNGHSFDSVWSSDLDRAIATSRLAWGEQHGEGVEIGD